MSPRLRRALILAAQVALAAAIALFVWRALAAGLRASDFLHLRFSLPYLLAAWVALLGYYALYSGGMHLILRLLGAPSTVPRAFKLNFATNVGKYLPGGIWPVLGRLTLGPRLGLSRRHVAPGMVLEAGMSIAGGLLVFLVSLGFGGSLPRGTQPWHWLALAGLVLAALLPPVFRRVLGLGFRIAKVDAEVPHVGLAATLGMVAYYALAWVVAGVAFRFYTLALVEGAPGTVLRYAGIWAVAAIGGLVVLFAPGGIGVREGVLALMLAPLVGPASATVVGFSARVWSTVLELVLSAVALALPVGTLSAEDDDPEGGGSEGDAAGDRASGAGGGGGGGDRVMPGGFFGLVVREWVGTPLVIALALLPGLGFAGVAARRIRLSWPETIATGFAFTVAMTSAVATVAHLAGLRLEVVIVAYLLFVPVSVVFVIREYRNGHLQKPALEPAGLLIGLGAVLIAMIERPWFRSGADTFYHIAATRSLLVTGRPLVTDPFHGTNVTVLDPTSGVWHTIQAVYARTLSVDVSTLYMGVTALGAGMIMMCFWVLARRVGGSAKAATVASIAMAVVAYHLDFRVMAYPKHISEALVFLGIALFVRLLEEPAWPVVGVAAVVGMATTTMHLAAAEFLFLAGGFLGLALVFAALLDRLVRHERTWRREMVVLALALVFVAVLSVPVLLPKVGALSGSSVMGADSYVKLRSHVMHVGNIDLVKFGGMYTGGPLVYFPMLVLLAVAAPAAFRDRDPRALAAVGLVAMIPFLLTNPLFTPLALRFSSYMTARMAALMRFMPFVGIAWALGRRPPDREQLMGRFAVACVGLAIIGATPDLFYTATGWRVPGFERGLDVYGLGATQEYDVRSSWGPENLDRMRRLFGNSYPVVAAEPHTGYYFAGLEPVAVVAAKPSHSPAYIEGIDGQKRRQDMERFFDRWTSEDERREIAKRYGVRYAAVWHVRLDPEVERSMLEQRDLFRPVLQSTNLDLLEVTVEGAR